MALDEGVSRREFHKRYPAELAPQEMYSVEQCRCEQNYKGLSCEECSPGYYRVKTEGSFGGACVPCECNGHARSCDVNTGVCEVKSCLR